MLQSVFHFMSCVLAGVLLQVGSCATDASSETETEADSGDSPSASVVPVDRVRVRFANDSTLALDVQFYAMGGGSADVATDLFVPANQVTAGIGFVGTGLLDAASSDEVIIPCASAGALGTRGGRFLSEEGAELGGGVQRIAAAGLQYGCGDTVTFIYEQRGEVFTTSMLIEE